MDKKTRAYLDTSAFIAFLDRSDTYHQLFKNIFSKPPNFICTTPLVIAEGHGWFLKRYDRFKANQFLNFIEDFNPLKIIDVNDQMIKKSAQLMRKFSDQDLTLTDGTGLLLMKEQKINCCWSTDFHLSLTGIPLVIH